MAVLVPCKNCTHRTCGCHSECEEYRRFKNELDSRRKQEVLEKLFYTHKRMYKTCEGFWRQK